MFCDQKRELNFCNRHLSLLYSWLEIYVWFLLSRVNCETHKCHLVYLVKGIETEDGQSIGDSRAQREIGLINAQSNTDTTSNSFINGMDLRNNRRTTKDQRRTTGLCISFQTLKMNCLWWTGLSHFFFFFRNTSVSNVICWSQSLMAFCCIVAWIQPDISGCQQDFLVVWRWN